MKKNYQKQKRLQAIHSKLYIQIAAQSRLKRQFVISKRKKVH